MLEGDQLTISEGPPERTPWWLCCEYCAGAVKLTELVPYEKAICPKCGAAHGWNDENSSWFGM